MNKFKDVLIISFLTIFLLEITIQLNYYIHNGDLLFYRINTPIYVKDPDYGHRVKPNLKYHHVTNEFNVIYYTNSKGFRCSDKYEEYDHKSPGYKIILNGPSFAFGWGVNYEESFAAILQKTLSAAPVLANKGIEVINFGVPSRSIPVQIRFFKNAGRDFQPSLLLQLAYGSMVLAEDDPSKYNEVENGYLINKKEGFEYAISKMKQSGIVFYSWIAYNRLVSMINKNTFNSKIIGAGRELNNYTEFDLNNKEIINSLKYYLDLHSFCQSINVKLIIIYFPLSYVVHEEDIVRWKHLGVDDIMGQIAFNKKFCDYLNKNGIVCLDLTEKLINEARISRKRLYYWLDVHWTPDGNQVAAESVAHYLLQHQPLYFSTQDSK